MLNTVITVRGTRLNGFELRWLSLRDQERDVAELRGRDAVRVQPINVGLFQLCGTLSLLGEAFW